MEKSNGKILSILLTAFVVFSTQMVQAQFCSVTTQDIVCNGELTGIITFNSSGGTAPYEYTWSHDAALTANEALNLPAGNYSVTVTDALGSEEICSVELTQPTPITVVNVVEVDPTCGLMDGSIEIEAIPQSGGILSDLMYSIDGGTTFQASNTFTDLGADDYFMVISDNNGCFIVESRQLVNSSLVVVNLTSAMCEPAGTVGIDIEPSGGTLPYDYLWSNGAVTQDIIGAPEGTYTVVVTDNVGCTAEGSYTVENCCSIAMVCEGTVTNVTCADGSDGMIVAMPTSGSGTYSYIWDTGETTGTISNLMVGFYNVTISDNNGCQGVCGFDVTEPSPIVIDDIVEGEVTCGSADGSLTITATPKSGSGSACNLEYSIDGGMNYQTSSSFTDLAEGDYMVIVRDCDLCTSAAQEVELTCFLGSIQGFAFEDTNGNGIYDPGESGQSNMPVYLFNSNGILISSSSTNASGGYTFGGISPGQYYVEFDPPFDYSFTLPNVGNDADDSDVTGAFGEGTTAILNFTGADLIAVNAGVYECVPVGELVWFDVNENDQWEVSENGINGLEVKVWKKGLGPGYFEYDNTFTGPKPNSPSDDGYYKFCLPPGEYYLEYIIPPFGLVPVIPGIGGTNNDSDLTGANGPNTTSSFSLLSGDEKCDLSAGYYPMATLGNSVFFDENSNGLADPNEQGMSDVMVEIYNASSGQLVDSQMSNADGSYLFDYLQKEDYYLKVIPPTDFIVTIANAGNDDDMDSDIDNSNGLNTSATFSLTPGMFIENVDIGFVQGITVAVDWVSITGEHKGSYNQIDWSVGFQNNTEYFEVERRTPEESSFRLIDKVESNNLASIADYQYQDVDIDGHSLTYYRVVEVDVNGERSYSNVVSIDFRSTARATKITMGPNPFISDLIIEIDSPLTAEATVSFWDISGKRVEIPGMNNVALSPGMNTLNFDWSGIPAGVYSAQVVIGNNQFSQKLMKIE